MTEAIERPSTPRQNAQRTIQDYQDATGCSRLRATLHWVIVCVQIVSQVAREHDQMDPKTTIALTNFTVAYEARDADLPETGQ